MSGFNYYNKAKYSAIADIGYPNFNFKKIDLTTNETNIELTDINNNQITARSILLICDNDCLFNLNNDLSINTADLEADLYLSIGVQTTVIYAKVNSGTATLKIYYVW